MVNVAVEPLGDVQLVRVNEPRLCLPLLEAFSARVRPLTEGERPRLMLDLARVQQLDAAGIGCLADLARRVTARGGAAVLMGLPERPATLVRMARLHRRLPLVPDRAAGVAVLEAAGDASAIDLPPG